MNIEDQKVVDFHYTLTNEQGETVESSRERDPMSYLHGANNIIPGLEQAMNGRAAGDRKVTALSPGFPGWRWGCCRPTAVRCSLSIRWRA